MPPHQLYHSAHSCHLDHFLLSQVLYHPCRELPAARALRCSPDTIKAEILPFLKAPQRVFFPFLFFFFFFFLKGGWWRNVARLKSAEKTLVHPGCTCVEPPAAAAAAARWCPLLCASSSLQTLHSICCCCALRKRSESKRRRKKKKERKKEKKPRSCPLDCTEIKVTVWRCLQAGDITVCVSNSAQHS